MADQTLQPTDERRAGAARLSDAEAVRLLSGADAWTFESAPGVGIGPVRVADGPHGLRVQASGSLTGPKAPTAPATCFPTAVTLAATWDRDLTHEVGVALAEECHDQGVDVLLGPGLNIKRHPCGGRNFEYFSEDPYLSGTLAAAMTRGLQSQGVGACLKHFAANNHETFRNVADAVVDPRTLRELYLRGFEIAVAEAQPWTVMCSYNLLNGEHCCEDHFLLTKVLRHDWGFDGVVMSDWGATSDRAAGVAGGLDVQMPGCGHAFDGEVLDALGRGRLDRSAVDASLRRLQLLWDRVAPTKASAEAARAERSTEETAAIYDAHHDLARRAAAAGTVLLSNDGVLPLAPGTRVALIGELADVARFQGAGSSQVVPTRTTTLRDELSAQLGADHVGYTAAYSAHTGESSATQVAEACRAAADAEVAVVVAGLPAIYESEGWDRDHLDLPEGIAAVVEAVCAAQPRTVVVLCNGAPVSTGWASHAAAVVEGYLGGQAGGAGLADVLCGAAEPGGRLAESFPVALADLPADRNFPGQPRRTEYRERSYVGYRFHLTSGVDAAFPFGHGLSYTRFEWGAAQVSSATWAEGDAPLVVRVPVTNAGDRAGSDVVQVYVEAAAPTLDRPTRELAGYAKVHLAAGETAEVEVVIDDRAFDVWDVTVDGWVTDPGAHHLAVARSSVDVVDRLEVAVTAAGAPAPATCSPEVAWAPTTGEFTTLLGRELPPVPPRRPFTRDTTFTELDGTWVGTVIRKGVVPRIRGELAAMFPEATPAFHRRFAEVALEAPLRVAVATMEGKFTLAQADLLLDVVNGRWGPAARGLAAELRGALRSRR